MIQIIPADTDAQYRQARELFAELSAWDMSQVGEMGLDAQLVLDFYYASGEEKLPGVYAPPEGRMIPRRLLRQRRRLCSFSPDDG